MIVTKQQLLDIIQVAKVMVDNHADELDGNYDEVNNINKINSAIDAGDELEIVNSNIKFTKEATGEFSAEVYSAILTEALNCYNNHLSGDFKKCVDEHNDINVPMSVTLVGCYIRYYASFEVLKIARA